MMCDEFEERIIKEIAVECPLMRKCLQLETMHQDLIIHGRFLDRTDEIFRGKYVELLQSVYDDFGLDIEFPCYTARRWRRSVIYRNSGSMFSVIHDDGCIIRNMIKYCDTSKANFLAIRAHNS